MTDTMNHSEQHTFSTLCSVLYLVHPKLKFIFQSCDRLKSGMPAAQKKNQKQKQTKQNKTKKTLVKKKTHLGQVFQSVTSFET